MFIAQKNQNILKNILYLKKFGMEIFWKYQFQTYSLIILINSTKKNNKIILLKYTNCSELFLKKFL